jgi:hypothetical protein
MISATFIDPPKSTSRPCKQVYLRICYGAPESRTPIKFSQGRDDVLYGIAPADAQKCSRPRGGCESKYNQTRSETGQPTVWTAAPE